MYYGKMTKTLEKLYAEYKKRWGMTREDMKMLNMEIVITEIM